MGLSVICQSAGTQAGPPAPSGRDGSDELGLAACGPGRAGAIARAVDQPQPNPRAATQCVTGRTPGRSLRSWRRLPHDFRMEPCGRREHRQVLLLSRVLPLNEQETTRGDTEGVRFVVRHLAARCRSTAEVDLDSHDRAPFVGGRISNTCHGTPTAARCRISRDRPGQQLLPRALRMLTYR